MIYLTIGIDQSFYHMPVWAMGVVWGVVCGWFARGRFRPR